MPAAFRILAGLAALLAVTATLTYLPAVVSAQTLSADATLSALTVNSSSVAGFASGRTSYEIGVASTVTTVTVAATKNHSGASVVITPTDSSTTPGHQVSLTAGKKTVTAQNTTTTRAYTLNINRG